MKIYGLCEDFGKKVCVISALHKNDLVQKCDSQTWYTQLIFYSQQKKHQIATLFINYHYSGSIEKKNT